MKNNCYIKLLFSGLFVLAGFAFCGLQLRSRIYPIRSRSPKRDRPQTGRRDESDRPHLGRFDLCAGQRRLRDGTALPVGVGTRHGGVLFRNRPHFARHCARSLHPSEQADRCRFRTGDTAGDARRRRGTPGAGRYERRFRQRDAKRPAGNLLEGRRRAKDRVQHDACAAAQLLRDPDR